MKSKVLIIEDEFDIAQLVKLHLSDVCDKVEIANNGLKGLEMALNREWSLIILDLRLPGMDGIQVCQQIRAKGKYMPILMLTAKSTELDRVLGLEIGADDYLTKPFSVLELVARVKALLRRFDVATGYSSVTNNNLAFEDLQLFPDERKVLLKNQEVELTAKEFDLLYFFASNPNIAFKRSQLLDQVWGYGHDGYEHTVNSHMNRLRNKIEDDPDNIKFIKTIWGVGYKFIAKPI
ncbi:MAG: response regulator transcription factor [Alcanivoracaceae bacterium]|nr:response regulator transcription factor [Alcanivoracaceae bacterium]